MLLCLRIIRTKRKWKDSVFVRLAMSGKLNSFAAVLLFDAQSAKKKKKSLSSGKTLVPVFVALLSRVIASYNGNFELVTLYFGRE